MAFFVLWCLLSVNFKIQISLFKPKSKRCFTVSINYSSLTREI
jgi:hypothetical protein